MRGKKILIIGCGYLGQEVAARLAAQEAVVVGWVRSRETAAQLSCHLEQVVVGDLADPETWRQVGFVPDAVVHAASSGKGGADMYAQVYREGMRQILRHVPQARLVFVSSTSVYGQTDGSVVTEASPAEPATETGKILREAEVLALGGGGIVLRAAGIYGPGRGVLWKKFLAGEAVIEGDGLRWINQIHRDDLASTVIHLVSSGLSGIFNGADDAPVTTRDFYTWCAAQTGKPFPPSGPVNLNRKRGVTNKRVSNAALRATGWVPQYPSFREGLADDLRTF